MIPILQYLEVVLIPLAILIARKDREVVLMIFLALDAQGMLISVIQIENGGNYYLWNIIALFLTGKFALDWKKFRANDRLSNANERYLMRTLFYDTLPQQLWRDPRRISLWRKPE